MAQREPLRLIHHPSDLHSTYNGMELGPQKGCEARCLTVASFDLSFMVAPKRAALRTQNAISRSSNTTVPMYGVLNAPAELSDPVKEVTHCGKCTESRFAYR